MEKEVKIKTDFITLGQFIKFNDIVSTGGEVKYFLSNNIIKVNDVEDNRRGKKLYKGDKVEIKGIIYKIC